MVIAVLIISFILDSLISNFLPLNSLFAPLFTVVSLIIIYPYFTNHNHKGNYLLTCFITGVFYDLIYTNTIIHGFLFLVIGFIIMKLNLILSNNYVNVAIMAIIIIIIYRIIAYGLLLITDNLSFNILVLLKSIYSSLIANIIYVVLAFIITDKIATKLKIHRAN